MSLGIRTYGNAQQDDKAVQDNIKKYGVPQGPFAVPVRPDSRKAGTNVEDVRNWQRYVPYLVEKTLTPGSELSPDEQSALPSALNVMGYDAATLPQPGSQLAALMQQLGIGGGRGGPSAKDKQAAAERKALNDWYRSGGHLKQYEGLRSALQGQIGASRQAAQGQYDTALRNILGGYTGAEQMMGTGYNAVADYLRQNMPNAYAGFQAAPVAPEQASQGYFGAYGVDMAPVMAQIAADQSAAQAGGGMFSNLVDVLNRSSQQAALSRQAELELARNLGMQNLGQQRAAMESNAMSALQQALGQISQTEQDKLYEIAAAEAAAKAEGDQALAPGRAEQARREAKAKAKAEAEAKAKAEAEAKARAKGGKGNKGGKK